MTREEGRAGPGLRGGVTTETAGRPLILWSWLSRSPLWSQVRGSSGCPRTRARVPAKGGIEVSWPKPGDGRERAQDAAQRLGWLKLRTLGTTACVREGQPCGQARPHVPHVTHTCSCPRPEDTGQPTSPHGPYPESTPSTRLSMKKEPMMMRGMKYSQFHVLPAASFVWKRRRGRACGADAAPAPRGRLAGSRQRESGQDSQSVLPPHPAEPSLGEGTLGHCPAVPKSPGLIPGGWRPLWDPSPSCWTDEAAPVHGQPQGPRRGGRGPRAPEPQVHASPRAAREWLSLGLVRDHRGWGVPPPPEGRATGPDRQLPRRGRSRASTSQPGRSPAVLFCGPPADVVQKGPKKE